MEDVIYRQDAVDALQKEINKGIPPFDDVMGSIRCGVRLARNIIEDLPSAQQWIPCSEMLPMDEGVYLVTDDSGRVAWVEKSWFMWCDDGSPFWEYANVTAWMPLPKPYKEEK